MRFRDRLLASLRDMQPVLDIPEVMVGGSQVPNLLESEAAATLVVSQDVDLVIPVSRHAEVKRALNQIRGYRPAPGEPSVWIPDDSRLLEINFIQEVADLYAGLDDEQQHTALASLTILSLMKPIVGMPDPAEGREEIARLLRRLEALA